MLNGSVSPLDRLAVRHYATNTGRTSMSSPTLWLRSFAFNVGWYLGSAVIAIVGAPILLAPCRPVVGWAMARAGNIAVARGDGGAALRGLVRQAKAALDDGRSIVIFPEGTRVAPGDQRPYQVGAAALYRQLGVPVVPMALNSGLFWGHRQWVKRPGVITLEILPPIEPGLSREAFMEILRDRIESATNRLINIP